MVFSARPAFRAVAMLRPLPTATLSARQRFFIPATHRDYHEKVIEHYTRPRNAGSLDRNDPSVGSALVGAPACGDVMKLDIRVDEKSGRIIESKFKTFGCGSAIASSSYLTTLVEGMRLEDADKIKNIDISKELCLPPVKLHCSLLAEDAIKSAIANYRSKRAGATNLAAAAASTLADVAPKPEVGIAGGAAAN